MLLILWSGFVWILTFPHSYLLVGSSASQMEPTSNSDMNSAEAAASLAGKPLNPEAQEFKPRIPVVSWLCFCIYIPNTISVRNSNLYILDEIRWFNAMERLGRGLFIFILILWELYAHNAYHVGMMCASSCTGKVTKGFRSRSAIPVVSLAGRQVMDAIFGTTWWDVNPVCSVGSLLGREITLHWRCSSSEIGYSNPWQIELITDLHLQGKILIKTVKFH